MRTAIAAMVLSAPLFADVAFRESCTYESREPREPFVRTTYLAKDKLRVDESDGSVVRILRLDRGVVWVMGEGSPMYVEIPLKAAAAAAVAQSVSEKKALQEAKTKLLKEIEELQERLKKEKDAKAKAAMEADVAKRRERLSNVQVALDMGKPFAWCEPTGEKAQILNHPTVKWSVYVSGVLRQEAWISDEFKGVEDYRKLVSEAGKKLGSFDDETMMDQVLLEATKGIPLKRRRLAEQGGEPGEGGESVDDVWLVSEVTELVFTPVAQRLFELPSGAKKR